MGSGLGGLGGLGLGLGWEGSEGGVRRGGGGGVLLALGGESVRDREMALCVENERMGRRLEAVGEENERLRKCLAVRP